MPMPEPPLPRVGQRFRDRVTGSVLVVLEVRPAGLVKLTYEGRRPYAARNETPGTLRDYYVPAEVAPCS